MIRVFNLNYFRCSSKYLQSRGIIFDSIRWLTAIIDFSIRTNASFVLEIFRCTTNGFNQRRIRRPKNTNCFSFLCNVIFSCVPMHKPKHNFSVSMN